MRIQEGFYCMRYKMVKGDPTIILSVALTKSLPCIYVPWKRCHPTCRLIEIGQFTSKFALIVSNGLGNFTGLLWRLNIAQETKVTPGTGQSLDMWGHLPQEPTQYQAHSRNSLSRMDSSIDWRGWWYNHDHSFSVPILENNMIGGGWQRERKWAVIWGK